MNEAPYPRFPPPTTEPIAITNVDVIPMDADRILRGQTVIIDDGRIAALDDAGQVPADAMKVVDGSGKFLMPGLADMHVHYWDVGEFGLFLANGVTQVRNMWGSPFHLALQRKVADGAFPGPRITTTSPIIDGPGPNGTTIWPNSALAADAVQAESLVRNFARRGYQQTKAYSWLKLGVLQALGRASREVGIRLVGHCPDGVTYEEAIAAGMTCFEHLTGIAEGRMGGHSLLGMRAGSMDALRTVVENLDLDGIRGLAHELAEQEIWNCPTLVVWQGMSRDEAEAMADPRLVYEPGSLTTGWAPSNDFRLKSTTASRADWLKLAQARIDLYLQVISILHQEGAPLLLGTDTPNPFVFQGFSIHDELANLTSAGLTPFEALRAGTADAARFLDEGAEWGTVAVGKRANLLLLDRNPLRDVGAVREPRTVFVNGYALFRDDLDALLQQRVASVHGGVDRTSLDLPSPMAGSTGAVSGQLLERVAGSEVGAIRYRHTRLPDRSWLVEEVARHGADSLQTTGGTTNSRLELAPALDLRRAEVRTESFVGEEGCEITLQGDDRYEIRWTDVDGVETISYLAGPLPPGEDLSLTVLPLLLRERPAATVQTLLGIDHAHAVPLSMHAAHTDNEPAWEVHLDRPGTSSDQTYTLAPDGNEFRMEEMTWRGLREVAPEGAPIATGPIASGQDG